MDNKEKAIEIKPCPFCGEKPRLKTAYNSVGETFFQVKHDCKCLLSQIKTFCYKTELEAITAWNNRAEPKNDPLTLEELKQMIKKPIWCERPHLWGVLGEKNGRFVVGFTYGWEWLDDVTSNGRFGVYRYEKGVKII